MENTYINNSNKEDENKLKNLEARRRAARAFHERNKDNEVYKQKQRENSKRVYNNDKDIIYKQALKDASPEMKRNLKKYQL